MMAPSCRELVEAYLLHQDQRFHCYETGGRLWVVSPYLYPDGDLIEVAVRPHDAEVTVTDLGEALRHLGKVGFDPAVSPKADYLLTEVLKQQGAELDRGMIVKRVPRERLGEALESVLAACLGVAHVGFLAAAARPATFPEEVGQLLSARGLYFETGYREAGRSGKVYRIHFRLGRFRRVGLMQVLAPTTPGGMTAAVNATFRLWSDLENSRWRATVLDDRRLAWRPADVNLLQRVSAVYRWTERENGLTAALDALRAEDQPT